MGLLSITLVLLYRASQRVGVGDRSGYGMPFRNGTSADTTSAPPDVVRAGNLLRLPSSPPVHSGMELGDDAPAGDQPPTDSAPAGSGPPELKAPPPATGIIRTPAF